MPLVPIPNGKMLPPSRQKGSSGLTAAITPHERNRPGASTRDV